MIDGVDKAALYIVCGMLGYMFGLMLKDVLKKRRERGKNRHNPDPS